jgi:hypothetical protein
MAKFLVEYEHEGRVWALELFAENADDAARRVAALASAALQGELVERIAAPRGAHLHTVS